MEAYANAKLQDLSLYNPNNSIEGKLVPKKQCGALCVQVTLLSLTHHDIVVALLLYVIKKKKENDRWLSSNVVESWWAIHSIIR